MKFSSNLHNLCYDSACVLTKGSGCHVLDYQHFNPRISSIEL